MIPLIQLAQNWLTRKGPTFLEDDLASLTAVLEEVDREARLDSWREAQQAVERIFPKTRPRGGEL